MTINRKSHPHVIMQILLVYHYVSTSHCLRGTFGGNSEMNFKHSESKYVNCNFLDQIFGFR